MDQFLEKFDTLLQNADEKTLLLAKERIDEILILLRKRNLMTDLVALKKYCLTMAGDGEFKDRLINSVFKFRESGIIKVVETLGNDSEHIYETKVHYVLHNMGRLLCIYVENTKFKWNFGRDATVDEDSDDECGTLLPKEYHDYGLFLEKCLLTW